MLVRLVWCVVGSSVPCNTFSATGDYHQREAADPQCPWLHHQLRAEHRCCTLQHCLQEVLQTAGWHWCFGSAARGHEASKCHLHPPHCWNDSHHHGCKPMSALDIFITCFFKFQWGWKSKQMFDLHFFSLNAIFHWVATRCLTQVLLCHPNFSRTQYSNKLNQLYTQFCTLALSETRRVVYIMQKFKPHCIKQVLNKEVILPGSNPEIQQNTCTEM